VRPWTHPLLKCFGPGEWMFFSISVVSTHSTAIPIPQDSILGIITTNCPSLGIKVELSSAVNAAKTRHSAAPVYVGVGIRILTPCMPCSVTALRQPGLVLQPHLSFASLVVCASGAGLVASAPA